VDHSAHIRYTGLAYGLFSQINLNAKRQTGQPFWGYPVCFFAICYFLFLQRAPTVWMACPGPGSWRADVGIGPCEAESSTPGGNRKLSTGGCACCAACRRVMERARSPLPLAHIPRCSVPDSFSEVYLTVCPRSV